MFLVKAIKLILLPATLILGYTLWKKHKAEAFCANCGTIQDASLLHMRCPSCTTTSGPVAATSSATPPVVVHPAYKARIHKNITQLRLLDDDEARGLLEDLTELQEVLNNEPIH